jgi:pimeloyl-ACP methyl ester carboxylesterase
MKAVLVLLLILTLVFNTFGQSSLAEFITVAGKRIAYKASGLNTRKHGEPLIVFEAGAGSGKESFEHFLRPVLAKDMPWVMYDRAGLAGSEADEDLKTDTDVVKRLHDFLKALNLSPPYLLVGHSMGGPLIRLFAGLYPNEVAGLVLIDPTNFMLTRTEDEQIKKDSGSQTGYIDLYVGMLKKMSMDTLLPQGMRSEMKRTSELHASGYFKEYSSLALLPNIPTTIMIAYNSPIEGGEKELFKEYKINGVAWFEQVNKYRIQSYAHMIKNHTNSLIMLLPGYQHVIHHRDPQLAAATIADVYRKCIRKP